MEMNKSQKFIGFLESLKNGSNDTLIEGVIKGYALIEGRGGSYLVPFLKELLASAESLPRMGGTWADYGASTHHATGGHFQGKTIRQAIEELIKAGDEIPDDFANITKIKDGMSDEDKVRAFHHFIEICDGIEEGKNPHDQNMEMTKPSNRMPTKKAMPYRQ